MRIPIERIFLTLEGRTPQEVPISTFFPKRVNLFCIHTELRSLDYPIQETDNRINKQGRP
jgi:hypothetical protein